MTRVRDEQDSAIRQGPEGSQELRKRGRPAATLPLPRAAVRGKVPAGVSRLERLKGELRSANERADKAEAALAAVTKAEAVTGEVWRLNQQIARLRGSRVANRREKVKREQRQQKPPSCTGDSSRSSVRPGGASSNWKRRTSNYGSNNPKEKHERQQPPKAPPAQHRAGGLPRVFGPRHDRKEGRGLNSWQAHRTRPIHQGQERH